MSAGGRGRERGTDGWLAGGAALVAQAARSTALTRRRKRRSIALMMSGDVPTVISSLGPLRGRRYSPRMAERRRGDAAANSPHGDAAKSLPWRYASAGALPASFEEEG
jgi:hypothetical protein